MAADSTLSLVLWGIGGCCVAIAFLFATIAFNNWKNSARHPARRAEQRPPDHHPGGRSEVGGERRSYRPYRSPLARYHRRLRWRDRMARWFTNGNARLR